MENKRKEIAELLDLPSEILLLILSSVNFDDLFRLSEMCRRLYDVTCNDNLWKNQCHIQFLLDTCPEDLSWKQLFLRYHSEYGQCIPVYRTVRGAWNKIEKVLETMDEEKSPQLNGPATEEEIRAAESRMHCRFPDDLRCSLKIHNGQRLEGFGLYGSVTISSYFQSQSILDCNFMADRFEKDIGKTAGSVPITFCNRSDSSQYLAILPTAGYPVGRVYIPVKDHVSDKHDYDHFITGSSFSQWLADLAEKLSNFYPKIQGIYFRFVQDPNCLAITEKVFTVKVATCFIPEISYIHPSSFKYCYRITMSMDHSADPGLSCQLETRHWTITDEDGKEEYGNGPGVVGEFPVMKPGAEFSWISCTSFKTTYGNMKGYFTMRNLRTGETFHIDTPCFHMKCLPYETSQETKRRLLEMKKNI